MNRKFLKFVFLLAIGTINIDDSVFAQQKHTYSISGDIKKMPDNIKLSLITNNDKDTQVPDTLQTVYSKSGRFMFSFDKPVVGKLYFLMIDTTNLNFPVTSRNWTRIIIDANLIRISGSIDQWASLNITGSKATEVIREYFKAYAEFKSEVNPLLENIQAQIKFKPVREIYELLQNDSSASSMNLKRTMGDWFKYEKDFVAMNKESIATPSLVISSQILSLEEKNSIYNQFPEQVKNSFPGKQLKDHLANEKTKNMIGIGKEIPDFSINTPEGKSVSIKKLIAGNKLTLLDFWASWCHPCRDAIPHLKELYAKHNMNGFNIIGVVLAKHDKDAAWKKALKEDDTRWNQGMDMTNISDQYFPKNGIPGYLLVDSSAKIIASDLIDGGKGLGVKGPGLRGDDLAKTISDLLDK